MLAKGWGGGKKKKKKKTLARNIKIYLLKPMFQNTVPINNALIAVKSNLMALYCGLLQYTRFCFHRQVLNWENVSCEYVEGNFNGSEPVGGTLKCLMEASTSLEQGCQKISYGYDIKLQVSNNKRLRSPVLLRISVNVCKVFTNSFFSSKCSHLEHPSCWIVTTVN